MYIIQPCTRLHLQCRFIQSHIVYAWVAVTCHLHFWQNDWGLLRATSVRNKSQHRKLTTEKKILAPLQQGFELATFRSRVRRSNHWAIPAPRYQEQTQHDTVYPALEADNGYLRRSWWRLVESSHTQPWNPVLPKAWYRRNCHNKYDIQNPERCWRNLRS